MPTAYRRLREDFLTFMLQRDALPKEYLVANWLRSVDSGVKSGAIGRLYKREHVSEEIAEKLIRYLLDRGSNDPNSPLAGALNDYLQSRHGKKIDSLSSHSIADLVLETDCLSNGIQSFLSVALEPLSLVDSSRLCEPDDIADVIQWMYVDYGRTLKPTASLDEAEEVAVRIIGKPQAQFTDYARAWHAYDRWTVVASRFRQQDIGASLVLPLKPDVYEEIRCGKRLADDCAPSELQRPSSCIVLLACAHRPKDLEGPEGVSTMHMNLALMRQIGVLTYCTGKSAYEPLRVLSFGASPLSQHRLRTTGFKPVGANTPLHGFPLYEYVLRHDLTNARNYFLRATLRYMGYEYRNRLKPKRKSKL